MKKKKKRKSSLFRSLVILGVLIASLFLLSKYFLVLQIDAYKSFKSIGLTATVPFGYKTKYFGEDLYGGERLIIMPSNYEMKKTGEAGYDYPENEFAVIYHYQMKNIYTGRDMGDFQTARAFLTEQDKIMRNPPPNTLPIAGYGMDIKDDVTSTFTFTKDIVMINRPFCLDSYYSGSTSTSRCLLFLTLGKSIKGGKPKDRDVYEILVVFPKDEKKKVAFENTAFKIVDSIRKLQ